MPNRESQKYTRYVNDPDEGDDDEEERHHPAEEDQEQDLEDYEQNQMQEGRRVLAMVTPKHPKNESICSRSEYGRIMLVVILATAICFVGGVLFGYKIGNVSSVKTNITSLVNQSCLSLLNYTATTTSTTTALPEVLPTPIPEFEEPDILAMTTHFLSHFTPELLQNYVSNISSLKSDYIRGYIRKSLEPHGFIVEEKIFPVMSSVSDKKRPNTVEIVMKNKTVIVNNSTSSLKGFQPFSGFSPNGTASGLLVYANYGLKEDFELLDNNNITVNNSILLIKLVSGVHPGVQVRHAEERGAKGVILYPDPKDFGEGEKNPRNDSLPPDGVVWQNLRMIPGDPSTPFYASQKEVYRSSPENYIDIPSIVVQPVSSNSGLELLQLLGGPDVPEGWKGSLNVTYRFGGAFNNDEVQEIKIVSNNLISETYQHIIFAYLPAKDHSKVIQVGCHYDIKDSQLTSSGIGLAGLLALGNALKITYPNGTDRLIVLSAFEGKDGDFSVGLEYSQLYSWWLESTALAYVDMDEILQGKGFIQANVSPILRKLAREALSHVPWVEKEGLTAYQGLISVIPQRMGGSSNENYQESFDFTNPYECDESVNFLNVHGIPSLQFTAINIDKSQNFHLGNSQYDTMELIQRYEDTDLHWSHMIVSAMGVSILLLACTPLPPIRFDEVGWDLSNAWKTFLTDERKDFNQTEHPTIASLSGRISDALDQFVLTSESYDTWYKDGKVREGLTPLQIFRNLETRLVRFQQFGRRFLRPRNIPRHSSFGSYLIYGPSPDDSCSGAYFPFVRKALKEAKEGKASWDILQEELSLLISSLMDIRTDP